MYLLKGLGPLAAISNLFELESHTMSGLEKLGVGLELKPVNFSETLKWVNKIYTDFNVMTYKQRTRGTSHCSEMNKYQGKILNLLMNLCGLHSGTKGNFKYPKNYLGLENMPNLVTNLMDNSPKITTNNPIWLHNKLIDTTPTLHPLQKQSQQQQKQSQQEQKQALKTKSIMYKQNYEDLYNSLTKEQTNVFNKVFPYRHMVIEANCTLVESGLYKIKLRMKIDRETADGRKFTIMSKSYNDTYELMLDCLSTMILYRFNLGEYFLFSLFFTEYFF